MDQVNIDTFIARIGSEGVVLQAERIDDYHAEVLLQNPAKVPYFVSKFLGKKPYRDIYGRVYIGGAKQIGPRKFLVYVEK